MAEASYRNIELENKRKVQKFSPPEFAWGGNRRRKKYLFVHRYVSNKKKFCKASSHIYQLCGEIGHFPSQCKARMDDAVQAAGTMKVNKKSSGALNKVKAVLPIEKSGENLFLMGQNVAWVHQK